MATFPESNYVAISPQSIIEEYLAYINNKQFPCVGAKVSLARQQIKCMVADHMACPKDDSSVLKFLYDFVDEYRRSVEFFHSAAIIFRGPDIQDEETFDMLLWQRLQSLANLDAQHHAYDRRVDPDPTSAKFSFSLKEEGFFIIGLHPASSRPARRFSYPVLVFNPHAEFERMRETDRYDKMKKIVRKRDVAYSGSVNPMLGDYGGVSEVFQYSGRNYDNHWQCPLKINHESIKGDSSP